jgi:hypothetical protein
MSNILNGITEAKRSPEPDYNDPSWDEKVSNVGQKAKQAEVLKSKGKEPKTRWNPETKKYYVDFSDVDESVGIPYPGTYEETNDMFKSGGQRRVGTLTTEEGVAESVDYKGDAEKLKKQGDMRGYHKTMVRYYEARANNASHRGDAMRYEALADKHHLAAKYGEGLAESESFSDMYKRTTKKKPKTEPTPGGFADMEKKNKEWQKKNKEQAVAEATRKAKQPSFIKYTNYNAWYNESMMRSAEYRESEVDGYLVGMAIVGHTENKWGYSNDDGKIVGLWYNEAEIGSFVQRGSSFDQPERYSEEDPNWPYLDDEDDEDDEQDMAEGLDQARVSPETLQVVQQLRKQLSTPTSLQAKKTMLVIKSDQLGPQDQKLIQDTLTQAGIPFKIKDNEIWNLI